MADKEHDWTEYVAGGWSLCSRCGSMRRIRSPERRIGSESNGFSYYSCSGKFVSYKEPVECAYTSIPIMREPRSLRPYLAGARTLRTPR